MLSTVETMMLELFAHAPKQWAVGDVHAVEVNGYQLRLTLEPMPIRPPEAEGVCELDVIDTVTEIAAKHGRRVTGSEVIDRIQGGGDCRPWGSSTILNALAALVHKGLLANDRNKKGYGLPTPQARVE